MRGFLTNGLLSSIEESSQGQEEEVPPERLTSLTLQSKLSSVHGGQQPPADDVDWERVGRVYDLNTELDTVLGREFGRLTRAID
jgi:hypothetical protein